MDGTSRLTPLSGRKRLASTLRKRWLLTLNETRSDDEESSS